MIEDVEEGLIISGIDGGTPLGFLAALGLLQVLDESAAEEGRARPRLSWQQLDAWRPVLHGAASFDSVVDAVTLDAKAWQSSTVLSFRYVKLEKKGPKPVGGLKAPLAAVRAWQRARREAEDEGALTCAAALFCDGVTDALKKPASEKDYQAAGIDVDPEAPLDHAVERTFLDFTARNAQFLEQVEGIRAYLDVDIIRTALEQGAPDVLAAQATRTLDWDPSSDTPGSIYTGYRRGFLPVHEWLGFRGLRLFPLGSTGSRVKMTGCSGRRLRGEFMWPLWTTPAPVSSIASLVGYPGLSQLAPPERRALGIVLVLCAQLTRKADGYTGTFSPTRPL